MVCKIKCFILILVIITGSVIPSYAAIADYAQQVKTLNLLGLFSGTDKGFELDRNATRIESAAMLVKLLGKEEEAKKYIGFYRNFFQALALSLDGVALHSATSTYG